MSSWKSSVLAFASQKAPRLSSRFLASSGYTLDPATIGPPEVFDVWTAKTAERQDRSWQALVAEVKSGHPRRDVEALYESLAAIETDGTTILEVGCGGGYYSEIISHRFPNLKYEGLDISPASIALARVHYPSRSFLVGSAYELPHADHSVDIVMDGVALVQIPEWKRAVSEYGRVARRNAIIHGVTITESHPTTLFAKYAYGQPSFESVYNRAELLAECESHGLRLIKTVQGLDYDLEKFLGIPSTEETWLLEVS